MEVAASYVKTKFRVAERLLQGPATLSQIARDVGVQRQTVWHYLERFAENGIVEKRLTDDNTYVYAVVDPDTFLQKVEQIKTTSPRKAEEEENRSQQPFNNRAEKPSCSICRATSLLFYKNGLYLCSECLTEVRAMLDDILTFYKSLGKQA